MRTIVAERLVRLGGAALLAAVAGVSGAQGQYRHVDDKGRVTYSDVPPDRSATPLKKPVANAASSDATRQLETAKQEQKRLEAEERLAAQRRAAAARQPTPTPEPQAMPWRRGGYDPNQPPSQPASDSSRRY
jgi:hypothetical protein